MSTLHGKTAIITGGGSGIGKQIAIRFAEAGANVMICGRKEAKLQDTVAILESKGAEAGYAVCDVTKEDDLKNLVEKTVGRFGTIDILVNNAHGGELPEMKSVQEGYTTLFSFMEEPVAHYEHYMKGNLYSTINLMQLCIPYMRGKNDASIINFSSCSSKGLTGVGVGRIAFGTAKGAVAEMSRIAAYELGKEHIRVNIVYPGCTTDNQAEAFAGHMDAVTQALSRNPLGHCGDPYEDVAPVVVFLASEDSKFITGSSFYADGGNWMSM